MGVCPSRAQAANGNGSGAECAASPDDVRKRRLAKLSAPGDLDDSWQRCFLTGDLKAILMAWRAKPFPSGSVLLLLIEGPDDSLVTQKLRKFLWPAVADGLLSSSPASDSEVLAARLQLTKKAGGPNEDDASFVLKLFGLDSDAAPVALLMWGVPQVRALKLRDQITPESFRRTVADVKTHVKKDWAERGWNVDAGPSKNGTRVMEVSDLERRRAVEELHQKMAEDLLGAYSAKQAQDLMRRGTAKAGDFVVEDVAVSLDADAVAAEQRAIHASEREERDALRAEQGREFEEAQAVDRQRQEEEARRRAEAERLEEEAEAASVWAQMDKAVRLERLPPEPSEGDSDSLMITVVLPSTGRRVKRRWRGADMVSYVAEFAFGIATEDEIPYSRGVPGLKRGFPRCDLPTADSQSLESLGLEAREIVHAVSRNL